MENIENVELTKKKPNIFCLIGFGFSIVGLILSALCLFLGLEGLLIPAIIFTVFGALLSIWATSAAEKHDERFGLFGIAGIFISAFNVLFSILAFCF